MLAIAACFLLASCQPPAPPAPPAQATTPQAQPQPQPAPPSAADPNLPPALRLGLRSLAVQGGARVIPTLVIVKDPASYLAAIASWRPDRRFPVLIDDGTPQSHELIAIFARGFEPTSVVRWSVDPPPPSSPAPAWKPERRQIEQAIARAWTLAPDQADTAHLAKLWKDTSFAPQGVVLMHESDPAWTAGVALAAGRGQLPVFIQAAQGVDRVMSPAEADALSQAAQDAADASGWSWRALGDDLDAVTLCLNTQNRLDKGKGEFLAVTDRVGRLGTGLEAKDRWAYAGQVFGTPTQAAYRAMAALFIQPRQAWLFDGYGPGQPWEQYDASKAADILRSVGLEVEALDAPHSGASDWRARAARPLDAGLIFVNTKGNDDFFDLSPGQCKPGDVPLLNRPALANIIHSWSATNAGNRDRLAGRWLERGVFLYAGSVHEPYLQAFVPTPVLAGRLVGGGAFGACVRADAAPLWKITVIGDPLFALGKPPPRSPEALPLPGATDITAGLRELATGGRLDQAIDALCMAGRDADAARLAAALIEQGSADLTPAAARACIMPLARAGRNDLVWRAFTRLERPEQLDVALRDALWLTADPLLRGNPDPALLSLLRTNIRADMPGRDARTLAGGWARVHGIPATSDMLGALREAAGNMDARRQIEDVLSSSPDSWGP